MPKHTSKTDNSFSEQLICWYQKNKRDLPWRADKEPYHVWLSEIMLQQTRVEAVKGYYVRFIETLPDIASLASCDDDLLMKLWEGLGYYNRARNLKTAAIQVMEEYGGSFPSDYEDIRGLKGIGDYTAGAISSICFDRQEPAVDGNVLRVMSRIWADASNTDLQRTRKDYRLRLKEMYPEKAPGAFTQALMELGAMVCVPNGIPKCGICPVAERCRANQADRQLDYPVRGGKKARTIEQRTVFVLTAVKDGETYYCILKRPAHGLLSGLFEFPNVAGTLNVQEAADYLTKQHFSPDTILKAENYKHIFTHVEWHMTAYFVTVRNMVSSYIWTDLAGLRGTYALPTAFRAFLKGVI